MGYTGYGDSRADASSAQSLPGGMIEGMAESIDVVAGRGPDEGMDKGLGENLSGGSNKNLKKASGGGLKGISGESLGDIFPGLQGPESPVISGVAHDSSEALVTLRGILDEPGLAAHVFAQFAKAGVNIDMVVQALGRNDNGSRTADISITFPEAQISTVRELAESAKGQLGYSSADVNPSVGKVSLIGAGMKTHPGVTAQFFEALSREGINVLMISTSEIRISAIIPLDMLARGVRAVHTAFGLDSEGTQAIVYAGSGR